MTIRCGFRRCVSGKGWLMLRQQVRNVSGCESGAMADTFAIIMIPMMILTGAAVDYTRTSAADAKLQNAADTVLLGIARTYDPDADEEEVKELATAQMATMLPQSYDFSVDSLLIDGSTITLAATGSIPAGITGMLGIEQLDQGASSEVVWGADSMAEMLEVALVLDNTGSMSQGGRMAALKLATDELLGVFEGAEPGQVKVAIVPFDVNVRVPTTYKTASWFRTEWWVNWFWQGCLTDRDQSYDVSDAAATSAAASKYRPALCSSDNLLTIQPLTASFNTLYSKVDAMTPAGNTNITIGMAWGQTVLSSQAPYSEGSGAGATGVRKIIVLMTDGANTENRWPSSTAAIDERTALACQSAKNAGIVVYVIRLAEGDAELLENCASSEDTFYNVGNVADLAPTFRSIGHELSQLRLSR